MSKALLEVRNLVKHYPNVQAVNGVSLAIPEGVCFGLLGPNGAGKTTTIEIMEGINRPTSGEVLFRGEPIGPLFRSKTGIQFQSTALPDFLRVGETLKLFRSFYSEGMDIAQVIELCSLGDLLKRDTHKLSGGQRQRVLLALALVNDPDLLFLDEPTTGLDPQARRNFWDLVKRIRALGKTILLTTHYMDEAYILCDEIAIMDRGKIIAQGSPDSLLKKQFDGVLMEIPEEDWGATQGELGERRVDGQVVIHTTDANTTLQKLLGLGVPLKRLRVRSQTLDDLFLALTGKELRA